MDINKHKRLREIYNPDGSILRKAQLSMLELLIFLDKICNENNLIYWLDSGTLLGAARHEGFIPWDDDVDICMPTKDARRLKKIMGDSIFEGHIVLQTQRTDWNYINCGRTTLRDINSEYIQESNVHKKLKYKGLQIDIFEMEPGVKKWMTRVSYMINRILIGGLAHKNSSIICRTLANTNARIMQYLIAPTLRLFKSNNTVFNYAIGNPFYYSHGSIFPLKKITFENHIFNCPNDVDTYLKEIYGNWEEIPTADKIQTHNVKIRFFE